MVEHDLAKVGVAGSSPVSRSSLVPLLLAALLVVATPSFAQGLALAPGDPVPPVDGETLDGEFLVVDWGGAKATLLHFWTVPCDPCREEMATVQDLVKRHRRKGFRAVGVLTAPVDGPTGSAFLGDLKIRYPLMTLSPMTVRPWTSVTLLPTALLVGRDGRLLRRYVGADAAMLAGMRADVEAVVKGKPLPTQVLPGAASGQDAEP